DYLKANEEESVNIMAEGLELTVEEAADELSGVSFYGREENKAFIDKDSVNSIFDVAKRAQDFWLELGIINSEIDLDTFISAEYFG
ncbi:MAG: taurine ABC transporter substrate-binding protein, partial [Oscillospiraceae bacterium]|nr:taurine ABC transporter substrate-binding protein [Oscillospiraceae bacterium]